MPGSRKHHTDEMRSCVESVMSKGHDESAAYAICTASFKKADKPIFETAGAMLEAGDLRQLHLLGATGKATIKQLHGRDYIVVPVIALMEGVIHAVNADTPEFVPAITLQRAAASWNGRPVTLGHPTRGGRQCSANSPDIHASHGIGTIFNSHYQAAGKKLLQEAWIEKDRAEKLHPAMAARLLGGESVEVSVGAFTLTDGVSGQFNGKRYDASWTDTSGDHLAFLPDGRGACSIAMGCGAHRAAGENVITHLITAEGIEMNDDKIPAPKSRSVFERIERFMSRYEDCPTCAGSGNVGGNPCEACDGEGEVRKADKSKTKSRAATDSAATTDALDIAELSRHLTKRSDSQSYDQRMSEVQSAIDKRYSGASISQSIYAQSVFDDHVIIRKDGKLFSIPYTVNDKSEVELDDESTEVKIKTTYVAAADGSALPESISPSLRAACGCNTQEVTDMTKAERIAALLKHEHNPLKDQKALEAADDKALTNLEAYCVKTAAAGKPDATPAPTPAPTPTPSPAPAPTPAPVSPTPKSLSEQLAAMNEDDLMKVMPASVRTLVENQKAQETAEKTAIVAQLKVAAAGTYTEEELTALDLPQLRKLASLAKVDEPVRDFSGRGLPVPRAASAAADYTPPNPYEAGLKALASKAN